ncbi:hypothetical protein [Leucobacter sp. M11]|uniref:hypothetical protein n=1 Tax=Leucobacter sp. M11 TaxID=2993565 RepID=UPI002D7E7F93|nr:hypothetical protein [Leucobacter sp. M11]MEB4613946.1 hypothetical protein [Leucobacter sp. M11]
MLGAALLALLIPVVIAAISLFTAIRETSDTVRDAAAMKPATVYSITEREEFLPLQERVEATYQRYVDMIDDASIFEIVPHTDAGIEYTRSFLYAYADIKSALNIMSLSGGATSTSPGELDARLQILGEKADEYERRFLAGEDLDVTISITRADGSVFESDGTAPEGIDPRAAEEAAQEAAESNADPLGPDANGSYAAAGQTLVAGFGVTLDYDYSSIYASCMSNPSHDPEQVIASYCHATPDRIYINPEFRGYPEILNSPDFLDTVRHELAHHLVGRTCGTSAPPITGTANEGVANSYATLFLGADRDRLAQISEGIPEYAMSAETDELARGIRDQERCS